MWIGVHTFVRDSLWLLWIIFPNQSPSFVSDFEQENGTYCEYENIHTWTPQVEKNCKITMTSFLADWDWQSCQLTAFNCFIAGYCKTRPSLMAALVFLSTRASRQGEWVVTKTQSTCCVCQVMNPGEWMSPRATDTCLLIYTKATSGPV